MNKLKQLFARIRPYLPNKYVTVIVLFVILMLFFDKNNFLRRRHYERQARELRREIRSYERQRDEAVRQLEDLRIGTREIEKIAREQYLMKKDNEEIFILEED